MLMYVRGENYVGHVLVDTLRNIVRSGECGGIEDNGVGGEYE